MLQVTFHETLDAAEADAWQQFIRQSPHGHPRQDTRFAQIERIKGQRVVHAIGRLNDQIVVAGLFSMRPHPFVKNAYVDAACLSGPVGDDPDLMCQLLAAVAQAPMFKSVGALRVTSFWTGADRAVLQAALHAAGWHISESEPYRSTGWVDVQRDDDAILASFSKSGRREVRRAERQGITIHPVTDLQEARAFLHSLNRLRMSRGLSAIDEKAFDEGFELIGKHHDTGVILSARHDGKFVAGLQLYRGTSVAHGRHFTSETGALRDLGNLRIAPIVWLAGMQWAREKGCAALDVEGYVETKDKSDPRYNIYKYKSEFAPEPLQRLAENSLILRPMLVAHLTAKARARAVVRRLRGALGKG